MYILTVIKNIFKVLDSRTIKYYVGLQLFFFLAAFFQVVGIASIGPFISVLSNPEMIHTNRVLSYAYEIGGFTTDMQFILATAVGSLALILLSNAVAGLTMWFTYKFSVKLGSQLQQTVYRSFLFRDYLFHKTKNYNKLISIVAQQIPRFVYMVFQPFLLLTSQLFVALIILIGLLVLDPLLALIAAVLIGGSYLATYIFLRKALVRHGEVVSTKNSKVQSILSESFIGIKDVRLGSMERNYIKQFDDINVRGLRSQAFIALSGELPKFIIESISFGAILILALVLLTTQDDIRSVVPILSIYALAGYKLLPTMQQVYKSISSLSGHGSVAKVVLDEVEALKKYKEPPAAKEAIPIKTVELKDVSFSYPKAGQRAVDQVSLQFERGYIYSLAGHSGSGKSTLADLLLGLLTPESGSIIVNGQALTNDNLSAFRNSLSYVAQSIFILDDDVINNVAFGVPADKIDLDRVKQAITMANADDFVDELPKGLKTNLGQDGKLLSGGQRQRIGIARALYKQSDLLVLDEPTSALDMESEYKLLKTLNKIKHNLIILIISHRPASLKMSDRIILMDHGAVESVGSCQDMMEKNASFKQLMEMTGEPELLEE
ncbi:ABC transporter ATP-binding protein [Marinimicrobium sp. ABcell2]|uniref:ATP-binding cassette domain-containing protein n=1 Tax=Marinimicrobium sp. ABcell2 TaxID=3069751 RepID=UPI0027B066B9|nr:ABC transporter ATP-binding protein [Marinimicrobium sp. ABcell2]MDQ2076180.1 ABC transporter ATP-binding protein [Marinimicrobium sp. ABcell2]